MLKTRAVNAGDAGIQFADGSRLTVRNIVWATGYVASYGWLQVDGALIQTGRLSIRGASVRSRGYITSACPGKRTAAHRC
ncbi:hypothetical protein [Paenibacillus ihbetae]|uniref:hypothetical protein n=1 Tax=Paenibacillus ihbetae TaxID=1870820 RepID=UPI001677FCEA|nr:hypothetical protein [Paenibacillus ihbetae]